MSNYGWKKYVSITLFVLVPNNLFWLGYITRHICTSGDVFYFKGRRRRIGGSRTSCRTWRTYSSTPTMLSKLNFIYKMFLHAHEANIENMGEYICDFLTRYKAVRLWSPSVCCCLSTTLLVICQCDWSCAWPAFLTPGEEDRTGRNEGLLWEGVLGWVPPLFVKACRGMQLLISSAVRSHIIAKEINPCCPLGVSPNPLFRVCLSVSVSLVLPVCSDTSMTDQCLILSQCILFYLFCLFCSLFSTRHECQFTLRAPNMHRAY